MNIDLLDETYSMVKFKLYFVDIDHTGLTGGTHRSDRSNQTCQFWVRTYAPLFSGKACVPENIHKDGYNMYKTTISGFRTANLTIEALIWPWRPIVTPWCTTMHIDSCKKKTKDYTRSIDYNYSYLNMQSMAHASME
jgi:hypothetical protein